MGDEQCTTCDADSCAACEVLFGLTDEELQALKEWQEEQATKS
jgi:hypothetical protein